MKNRALICILLISAALIFSACNGETTGKAVGAPDRPSNAVSADGNNTFPIISSEEGPPEPSSGVYIWPVPGFHTVITSFAEMRDVGKKGIDIASAGICGAMVVAACDGTVDSDSYACDGWGDGYGTYCLINHEDGRSTLYAHLSKIKVSPGDKVRQGQVIGYVGATGDTDTPKLHFETRLWGVCYDPMSEF